MAIKSSLFIVLATISFLTACQSTPQKKPTLTGARPEIGLPPATPPRPAQTQVEEQTTVVPYEPSQPKKVAVILGPGGAKAFAHVGVLKAFQQQRIPIEKIVGLEWGSLIAGMFAVKGQTHDVEWKLYKMEQQNLLQPKGFFNRRTDENSIGVMDSFLNETFGSEEISKARVPFTCPTRSIYSGVVGWQNKGQLKEVMKRCLQFPPIFRPQGTFLAGASQASEAVEMLVKEGYNVIILVNVLGSALPVGQDGLKDNLNYVILWQEIRRAILETTRLNIDTVTVDTSNYPMLQFGAKKELISLGEAAGAKASAGLISKYGF